jgi:hypothetical protein
MAKKKKNATKETSERIRVKDVNDALLQVTLVLAEVQLALSSLDPNTVLARDGIETGWSPLKFLRGTSCAWPGPVPPSGGAVKTKRAD